MAPVMSSTKDLRYRQKNVFEDDMVGLLDC